MRFPRATRPTANGYTAGAYTFQTTARTTYDGLGRPIDVYDGDNNLTQTTYTNDAAGLTTGGTVTNPLGQTTSTTIDPRRGLVKTATDANRIVTTENYDALGRLTAVWANNRPITSPANEKYVYTVSPTGTYTETDVANETGDYNTSVTIYDGLLRPRETQSMTPQGGSLVTDTYYDSHGWATASFNGWYDSAQTPSGRLPTSEASALLQAPNETFNTYDGLGRVVISQSADSNVVKATTITVYGGDRTTVIPPTGGTVTTTLTDPIGRTASLQQYTARPSVTAPANTFTGTFTITGGTEQATGYAYDQHGNQNSETDAAGNTWTSTFNLLGQLVTNADPDTGTSTDMTYDGDGNLLQSTDARGKTVSATYDALNRETAVYTAATSAQNSTNELASWVYDNANNAVAGMSNPIGQLTTETAYNGGYAYTTQQTGFNVFGESIGEKVTIPKVGDTTQDALAGTYTFASTYTANNGLLDTAKYAASAGLPAENLLYAYNRFDEPTSLVGSTTGLMTSTTTYQDEVTRDAYDRVTYSEINSTPNIAGISDTYDPWSGNLTGQLVERADTTAVDREDYAYDPDGLLTQQTTTRNGATAPSEIQCFDYDELQRLTQAWTTTGDCTTTPTTADHSTVGDNITGSAYWTSWTFDQLGDRTQQVQHALTGGLDTTTNYTYGQTGHTHALTDASTSGATTSDTNYAYDADGNTTRRGDETLTYDDAGDLATVKSGTGTTTNIYDADGNLLLQKDPGTTTLYLPEGEQHTLNTTTGAVTGTRYYDLPGGGTAIRTGTASTAYTYALPDPHGTPTLYLDHTAQIATWRQYTPYGEPRGTTVTAPDNRGFLDDPTDTTIGLTQIGARDYDPTIGRFITVDPLQDLGNPQQWNGYAYAGNDPTTIADPSGMMFSDGDAPGVPGNPADTTSGGSSGGGGGGHSHGGSSTGGEGGGGGSSGFNKIFKSVKSAVHQTAQAYVQRLKAAAQGALSGAETHMKCEFSFNEKACLQDLKNEGNELLGLLDIGGCSIDILTLCKKMFENWGCTGVNPQCVGSLGADLTVVALTMAGGAVVDTVISSLADSVSGVAAAAAEAGEVDSGAASSGAESEAAEGEVETDGGGSLDGGKCSFAATTQVLMADGSTKSINDIKLGDKVAATDPTTGKTTAQTVTELHDNHDVDLADVVTTDGHSNTNIHTTDNHPFWDSTTKQWTPAGALLPGDRLLGENGDNAVRVVQVLHLVKPQAMYNLTVAAIHTYYVMAGTTPVLVHNCGGDTPAPTMADKPLGPERPDANPLQGTRYTDKVQEQIESGDDHGFPALIDTLPTMRDTSIVNGGDGIARLHVKLPGSVNGSRGTFHWIVEPDGSINHRFFDRRMK